MPSMDDLFRIADQDFLIAKSYLEAYVAHDRLCWGFTVQARSDDHRFDRWEPQASSDIFLESEERTLSSWLDLAPVKTEWGDRNDTDVCPSAFLYVFEHTPIYDCSVELKPSSDALRLSLRGKCDVNYCEGDFDKGLDIEIDAAVSFLGVYCGKRPRVEAEVIVEPFLPLSELTYTQDDAGVSIMVPRQSK